MDFIRFYLLDKERFDHTTITNEKTKLMSIYDIVTGEAKEYPKSGRFHNMEIKMTENYSYIKGSLHKMYNSYCLRGMQNYNDFDYCQTLDSIEILCSELNIKPQYTKLTNLEFGLNIPLSYDPKVFIENSLLMFDFEDHNVSEKFNNRGDYKEFRKSDYSIKIYNKSKQYGCKDFILRVEVKIIKKRVLERLGIFSLADLRDIESYYSLYGFLVDRFNKLLIVDSQIMRNALKTGQINMLKNYTNPHYWINLKQRVSTNTYYKRRRQCHEYLDSLQLNKSKSEIMILLKNKFIHLMNCYGHSYPMTA
ncbi:MULTISPECIES: hypothetical protein [Arenibacter]|uniref:hypothetical protein n=1 Tax=Arenibacter TaxID=178469 RepID=UPI0004DF383D|nr:MULTISPECIES: hypothetical protein [Arenibacter]GBF22541.1 hypothetical protein C21_04736 [Arenibacter sp. NBRC 103722]